MFLSIGQKTEVEKVNNMRVNVKILLSAFQAM